MINFFSNWAEQIIVAVVVTSIIDMILPNNKNKKYIKIVMGIYILFSIVHPILDNNNIEDIENTDIEGFVPSNNTIRTEAVNQSSMDERLEQLYIQELENNIKNKILEEGYVATYCKVDAQLYGDENKQEIKKIMINISGKSNNAELKDIDKNNIKTINKIEINTGLDKYLSQEKVDEDLEISNNEIKHLKEIISNYYEVEYSKIYISVK